MKKPSLSIFILLGTIAIQFCLMHYLFKVALGASTFTAVISNVLIFFLILKKSDMNHKNKSTEKLQAELIGLK